jgi:peptidoglycan/LPS O-acetylase OafA/YrhL
MAPYFSRLTRRQKITLGCLAGAWAIAAAGSIIAEDPGQVPGVVWTMLDILGLVAIYLVARMVTRSAKASWKIMRRVLIGDR